MTVYHILSFFSCLALTIPIVSLVIYVILWFIDAPFRQYASRRPGPLYSVPGRPLSPNPVLGTFNIYPYDWFSFCSFHNFPLSPPRRRGLSWLFSFSPIPILVETSQGIFWKLHRWVELDTWHDCTGWIIAERLAARLDNLFTWVIFGKGCQVPGWNMCVRNTSSRTHPLLFKVRQGG